DREQEERPERIRPDEQPPPAEPIDPGAGEQSDEEHGEALCDDDERHLEGTRPQEQEGDERHGRAGHDGPELGHRLAGPQLQEVVMSPQGWGSHSGGMVIAAPARNVPPDVRDPAASATIAGAHRSSSGSLPWPSNTTPRCRAPRSSAC